MKGLQGFAKVLTISVILSSFIVPQASASPNYARSTGDSCFQCHSKSTGASAAIDLAETVTTPSSFQAGPSGTDPVYNVRSKGFKAGLKFHPDRTWDGALGDRNNSSSSGDILRFNDSLRAMSGMTETSSGKSGFSGYVGSETFMASVGFFSPALGYKMPFDITVSSGEEEAREAAVLYRLAYTPRLGGMELTLGVFGTSNSTGKVRALVRDIVNDLSYIRSFGLDARIQGAVGGVSLDLKAVYVNEGADQDLSMQILGKTGEMNLTGDTPRGFSAKAKVGFSNDAFGLSAQYITYNVFDDTENTDLSLNEDEATIGAWINLSENIVLQPQYTTFGVGERIINKDGQFRLLLLTGF